MRAKTRFTRFYCDPKATKQPQKSPDCKWVRIESHLYRMLAEIRKRIDYDIRCEVWGLEGHKVFIHPYKGDDKTIETKSNHYMNCFISDEDYQLLLWLCTMLDNGTKYKMVIRRNQKDRCIKTNIVLR